jgi:reductive dehalogenase
MVGICRLPKYAVYSHDADGNPIDIDYDNAIVLVRRKEYRTLTAAKGVDWIISALSFAEYLPLAFTAEVIAGYIKKLGYLASPQSMAGGHPGQEGWFQTLMMPLLLWSGLGEVSRTHMILNPFIGLTVKASAVLTDIPLVPDKPIDFGLQDFCQHCTICAEACPSKAISFGDKVMYNGYETWKIDERRCMSFNLLQKRGTFCETCVKVCPWTRPNSWPHNLWRWANRHSGLARRLAIKRACSLGHHQPKEEEKWWFDMTYIDGVLKIPPKKE